MWHGPQSLPGPAEDPSSPTAPSRAPLFTPAEQEQILAQARRAIVSSLAGRGEPDHQVEDCPAWAMEWLGCFVTITVQGQLRGCIGQVVPRQPLHRAVPLLAIRAAREDRRFQPIETHELGDLRIEISVLGPLAPLDSRSPEKVLARLQPGELGVFLQCQGRSATYLPQVWRHLPDPVDFMDSLSRKAGLPPLAWRHPDAQISVYEVLAFTEEATMKAKSHPTSQAKQTKPAQDK